MRIRALMAGAAAAGVSLVLPLAPAAVAHEHGHVGDLAFEVGFATEPAYTGQPNAAQITFTHDGHPVMELRDMTVVVSTGGQDSEPMELEPAFFVEDGAVEFGTPGQYVASFVPTQSGTYTFHFVGTVEGEEFDETFRSGPKTFDDVQDISSVMFPQVSAPSNEELATRIDQESARTSDAVTAANDAASSAADDASGARTIGVIGIVVGALGLVVAIVAVAASRKGARG